VRPGRGARPARLRPSEAALRHGQGGHDDGRVGDVGHQAAPGSRRRGDETARGEAWRRSGRGCDAGVGRDAALLHVPAADHPLEPGRQGQTRSARLRAIAMRKPATNGDLSVRAIAGSYVTLLGVNVKDGSPVLDGLLGFAVWRRDHATNREGWLPGMKRFRSDAEDPHPSKLTSTHDNPLQGFLWGDYGVKAGAKYTYRVVPMYGRPGALREGDGVEGTFTTEPEFQRDGHSVYFNRGAAASQAYARKFKNEPPDREKNPDAYPWLSRGLEEGLQRFIGRAKKEGLKIRAAVYEFQYDRILAALAQAAR